MPRAWVLVREWCHRRPEPRLPSRARQARRGCPRVAGRGPFAVRNGACGARIVHDEGSLRSLSPVLRRPRYWDWAQLSRSCRGARREDPKVPMIFAADGSSIAASSNARPTLPIGARSSSRSRRLGSGSAPRSARRRHPLIACRTLSQGPAAVARAPCKDPDRGPASPARRISRCTMRGARMEPRDSSCCRHHRHHLVRP